MTQFTRTPQGQVNQFLFHSAPLIWVEGDTDVSAIHEAVRDLSVVVLPAGGKPECQHLIAELQQNDLPYVVVIDGDYEILTSNRSHRRVVILARHSIENYYFEKNVCEQVCRTYAGDFSGSVYAGERFDCTRTHIEDKLKELVTLDVARYLDNGDWEVLPKKIEALLEKQDDCRLDDSLVLRRVSRSSGKATSESMKLARTLLTEFARRKRLVDVLKGHLLFGLQRLMLSKCLIACGKRKLGNDDSLRALLAKEIWGKSDSPDHRALRTKLRKAVREVRAILR